MWSKGTTDIQFDDKTITCTWSVKHFEEPSEYGIDNGRISKLTIKVGNKDIVNYDRGWDIKPTDEVGIAVYKILIEKYN